MTEYRCYFAPRLSSDDHRGSDTNTIHILRLDSDEAARLTAEAICGACDHIRSFEIWQGDRFVYAANRRAPAPLADVIDQVIVLSA